MLETSMWLHVNIIRINLPLGLGYVLKVKDMVEQNMLWCIGNGDVNFWYDKFMDFKLCDMVYPPLVIASLSIKDALQSS